MSTFFRLKPNLATLPYKVTNWPLNNHIVMKYCFLESKYGMKQFVLTFVPCLVLRGSNEQRKYQFALKIILRECTTQSVCMATIVLHSNTHAMREWKWSRCSFPVWSRRNNDQCFLVVVVEGSTSWRLWFRTHSMERYLGGLFLQGSREKDFERYKLYFWAIQVGRDVTERSQRAVEIGSAFADGNAQK